MEFYKSALDRFRAFLEICFMLMTLWNLLKFLKNFVSLYITVHRELLDKQDDEMKLNSTFYRLLGINKHNYSDTDRVTSAVVFF
jgi:hypothetical protein